MPASVFDRPLSRFLSGKPFFVPEWVFILGMCVSSFLKYFRTSKKPATKAAGISLPCRTRDYSPAVVSEGTSDAASFATAVTGETGFSTLTPFGLACGIGVIIIRI